MQGSALFESHVARPDLELAKAAYLGDVTSRAVLAANIAAVVSQPRTFKGRVFS